MAVEWSVTFNGTTRTNEDLEDHGYADPVKGFGGLFLDILTHFSNILKATSTTSLLVSAVPKSLTLTAPFGAFGVGQDVTIARTSAPTTTYMRGKVDAFDGEAGTMTVDVTSVVGSGTHSDWTITVGGDTTVPASSPVSKGDGGTGSPIGSVGLGNLTAAVAAIVTTENTPAVRGVACYVLGDDEYPQWVDAVAGAAISPVMAVLARADLVQDEIEIYDVMEDELTRLTQANVGVTGITEVSKSQAGGRFAVGADDGLHVFEWQAAGLVEIANEFATETIEGIAVGYRADPPLNHATGGRIPIVACMFAVDASPVAVIMEDGRTFTQSNTAGGGVAIMAGRLYYADGGDDVKFVALDTIAANDWADTVVFGNNSDSNPCLGADVAMDSGGDMIAMADGNGLTLAKNFHGPRARNAVTSEEVWAMCQIENASNTGWSLGEARAIWLANSKTADRSNNANTLVQTGTVTEAAFVTGGDINGYSGWSALNYLSITGAVDFDFGADPDAIIMAKFWLQMDSGALGTQTILDMQDGVGNDDIMLIEWIAGTGLRVTVDPETGAALTVDSTALAADDTGYMVGLAFDSVESVIRLFINDKEVARTAVTASTHHDFGLADVDIRFGVTHAGTNPLTDGTLALFHIGASRPDCDWGDFFKFAYETEKALFVANAQAFLNSAGDTLIDVSYDAASGTTYAMQSDVINVFTGIERTTDDATPAGWTGTVNKGVATRTTKGLQTVLTASDEELYAERAAYKLTHMAPLGVSQMALAKILADAANINAVTAVTRSQYHPKVQLTVAANTTWDLLLAPNAEALLTVNTTFLAPLNIQEDAFYSIRVVQDGTGSRTGSWNAAFHFAGGTVPTLTTAANAVDRFVFQGVRVGNDLVLEQSTGQDVKAA